MANKPKDAIVKTNKTSVKKRSAVAANDAATPTQATAMNIELGLIEPNPFNRKAFGEQELQELAESIRKYGVQSDIKVRPIENGRYQIVYGERRYRASLLAGKTYIPAKVETMTDEQAETCATIENLQRENFTPFEEGEIFRRKCDQGASISEVCELFGKREDYVRGRMNLTKLIPEVADMLNRKDITLEVAKEFANYEETIQREVYEQHFRQEGYLSWKGIPAKEFAKRLFNKYMTKLDNYQFDKSECVSCGSNTFNQVLFTACGDCAGCQNMACLQKKNEDYLVNKSVGIILKDPRTNLAVTSEGNRAVIDRLAEMGYEVRELEKPFWKYDNEPEMPVPPVAEDYDDEDDRQFAQEDYENELADFKQVCTEIEFEVSEGTLLKYAVIGATSIDIVYDRVEQQTVTEDGITRTIIPDSPAKTLQQKDKRNHQICYEHITKDLKKVLRSASQSFPTTEITPREEQFLYYVLLDRISYYNKALFGLADCPAKDKFLEVAETLTSEQKTMLFRMAIIRYC